MKLFDILPPISLAFALIPAGVALGQLTPDNSLGTESSVVTPHNPTTDIITGGAARGGNLFHSFSEFNVDASRSVYFANPPAIENILTRVTGKNPSNILGTLGVLGEANLYLINPNGIVFGREARLDISGSFFATTGEGIKLGKNGLFSATDLAPNKLLHVRPEALFHNALANHMAQLNNQGSLAVGTGASLVLHGREIKNSGSLVAPSGTVMLLGKQISLLEDARIDVSSPTGGGRVFIGSFLQERGNITTADKTYIGPDVSISADALETGNGGNIIVWAEEITEFYGKITARGGESGGDGGFVELSGTESLIFRGEVDPTAAEGKAGTLLLENRNITIANSSPLLEIEYAQSIAADIFNSTSEEVTIYESQLEALSGETNIRLQATNDIVIEDLADDSLSFARGTGDITFIADADRDGIGDFSMADHEDTINTKGRDIGIMGASLTLGNIDTSLPAPDGAGELLSTAAVVSTGPGETLSSISGRLSSATDVDLYQIYLTGEGTFSATTVDGSNADTQLFLFDSEGLGVYGNDDNRDACNCAQSTLPAGDPLTPTAPGIYYLGINVFGVNPVSESGDIFAAATTSKLLEPTGGGGGLPLVGWEKVQGDDLGDYTITLTGVSASSATFIEEVIGNTVLSNSGAITLTATNGNLTVGDLHAASFSGAGGEIRLDAAADIVLDGSRVDASGVVGGGRDITLNSGGSILLNSSLLSSSTNGRGDAGKITIAADDTVLFSGGGASSEVNSDGLGNAGGIKITTGTLSVTDGANISASTLGKGDAGTVTITATERIMFAGESTQGIPSGTFSIVAESGKGDAGGIEITTGTLSVTDGAQVIASTFGEGDAGTVKINATNSVLFSGESRNGLLSVILSNVTPNGVGNGGDIEITTGTLSVTDGAQVIASTFGEGDAGSLKINAASMVLLDGVSGNGFPSGIFSDVAPNGVGNGGDIEITTGTLSVTDGAQLSVGTFGEGNAGTLKINATNSVLFSGEFRNRGSNTGINGAFSLVQGVAVGNGGDIEITTGTLSLTDGAQVISSTRGEGDAGNVKIEANVAINISGLDSRGNSSGLFAETDSEALGKAGKIILSTRDLNLSEAGVINVRTRNDFMGGEIEINANRLEVTGGAQIFSSSFGSGNAGTIAIDATDKVTISGIDPTYDSRVASGGENVDTTGPESAILSSALSRGTAGSVTLKTGQLQVNSGALLSVSSAEGVAGSLNLTADAINLNDGTLSAETADGDQGNINLTASDIRLFSQSKIITDATDRATGGDINIDTNILVLENSNITARAVRGQGGNIQITAQGIFQDNVSNIDASASEGIDGTVEIQTQVDPARGLISLAETPIDASSLISKGCEEYRGSEFIITGRGGIPPHPFEMLPGEVIWLDWRALTDDNSEFGYSVPSETSPVSEVVTPEEDDEIRQAQGWLQLPDGTVVLTAYRVKMTPAGPVMQHPGCQIILGDSSQ